MTRVNSLLTRLFTLNKCFRLACNLVVVCSIAHAKGIAMWGIMFTMIETLVYGFGIGGAIYLFMRGLARRGHYGQPCLVGELPHDRYCNLQLAAHHPAYGFIVIAQGSQGRVVIVAHRDGFPDVWEPRLGLRRGWHPQAVT